MGNSKKKFVPGNLLIAEPFMMDPNFKRSVVLLCDHDGEDGSLGFILNKSINMNIAELLPDFPEFDAEVLFGGPVQTDTLHFIHNKEELSEGGKEIVKGVYWGGNFDALRSQISTKQMTPNDIRFFVGYSGWSPGQLEDEMKMKSWILSAAKKRDIFTHKYNSALWKEVLKKKGNSYSVISEMPDTFTWN